MSSVVKNGFYAGPVCGASHLFLGLQHFRGQGWSHECLLDSLRSSVGRVVSNLDLHIYSAAPKGAS